MYWIVLKEKGGLIELTSSDEISGLLPKGSFLTIEEGNSRFILRVEESSQHELYSPNPLIVDLDLSALEPDRKCKNIIRAYRVHEITDRSDGLIDFIKPQSKARISTQEEINQAMNHDPEGARIFLATIQYNHNQLIKTHDKKFASITLPNDMFFHQLLICGKTGSGKTVAIKYLTQFFTENFEGAVLAINVKDVDLLKMDKPSVAINDEIKKEWNDLDLEPHGIRSYTIYYPANTVMDSSKGVNYEFCKKITLNVNKIEPEALLGVLRNISDIGAMNFPDLFRYWQNKETEKDQNKILRFKDFVNYFNNGINDNYFFKCMNFRGDETSVVLHRGTFDNISRNLNYALDFFDNEDAETIDETDILEKGKYSVIDVACKNGLEFGSILLRDLLHKIVEAKSSQKSKVPVLIVIDEVHMFYNATSSTEALGDLDTICRTGRSQQIGIIFSSQNPQDLPKGLNSVINTKIIFKSDYSTIRNLNTSVTAEELENLQKGFACVNIYDMPQLRFIKFPLALAGV